MNEYTEKIKISLEIKPGDAERVKKEIEKLQDENLVLNDTLKYKEILTLNQKLGEELGAIKDGAIANFKSLFSDAWMEFGKVFTEVFTDAWKELDEILNYSYLTNADVREQALSYGLSASENYALDKTMSLLGLDTLEDAYFMNTQQQAKFQEKFSEYTNRYNSIYDSGFFQDLQGFRWEWAEFKEDILFDAMEFITKNKETMKVFFELGKLAFKAIITVLGPILEVASWIVELLGGGSHEAARSSDVLAGYMISNNSNRTNINQYNTFDISGTQPQLVDSIVTNLGYAAEQVKISLGE